MLGWSAFLMAAGYVLSCGTRFYDLPAARPPHSSAPKLAAQPVAPTAEQIAVAREKLAGGHARRLLAEPPFVPPPYPAGQIG